MSAQRPRAAVIDIGSNSIKILVGQLDEAGHPTALFFRTLDVRISQGISQSHPRLSAEGMARGLGAVESLLQDAHAHGVSKIELVATSAVRDAANGGEFSALLTERTGHTPRILTGEEEANLIGCGLVCDPSLRETEDFYVFDLGGGSLEILAFRRRQIEQAVSLPLGCVRLTERFVPAPQLPFPSDQLQAIRQHTLDTLQASGFRFDLPPHASAIGTGGTVTTARTLFAARTGRTLEQTDSVVALTALQELLTTTTRLTLEDRIRLPGMPHKRADVFPTALATLVAIGERIGISSWRNSLYNLRWGVLASLLTPAPGKK